MEELNNSVNSASFENMESHSLSSSPSTFMTYQPNEQSPASSSSSYVKKENLDGIETKKAPSSHFLHDIIGINQDSKETEQIQVETQPITFQNFKPFISFSQNQSFFPLGSKSNAKNTPFIECVVCQDKSSGKHYGQYTCEGCKSFFKRSVRRNLTYQCRSSKNCPIDQYHRNQCQHCRFKKCLKMGMKKEAVQQGRNPANNLKKQTDSKINSIENSFLLKQTLEQKITPNFNSIFKNFFGQKEEDIFDFVSRFISKMYEFNASIPFFNSLRQEDQIVLLQANWSDLLFISLVQSNINFERLELDDDKGVVDENIKFLFFKKFKNLIIKLKGLCLESEEFLYLKGIMTYNTIPDNIENKEMFENYQNVCHTCLRDLSNSKDREKNLRFGKIILCMSQYWKEISPCQILDYILNINSEQELHEKVEKSCKGFNRNNNLSTLSESLYTLMSHNKLLNENFLRPKFPNSILMNPKMNENFVKYQNAILNSYFPVNYSNLFLNLRNPFLNANKGVDQSE